MSQNPPLSPAPKENAPAQLARFPGTTRAVPSPSLPLLPSTPLVGRTTEQAALISALRERSSPILTILGPGGVGKTRLALAVAWAVMDDFPDGVIFVPLGHAAPDLWKHIADHVGAVRQSGNHWTEAIRTTIADRRILLVLDDCEHVGANLHGLTDILAGCPNLTVILTSQEAFHVEVEQEFWLEPLDVPVEANDLAGVEMASAVELFVRRARRRNPSFTITEDNAGDIAAIVTLLDGLPMAIELAAGQTRHLNPSELLFQLKHSLPSLGGGPRNRPERHRSLISMVNWSLQMLSADARRRFLRLAVLDGDFTPEIAFRVMDVSEIEGWALLTDFADKSLVKRGVSSDDSSPCSPRFFLLQTLTAVARHILRQDPDEYAAALANQADAFLAIARKAARTWHGPDEIATMRALDLDARNIRAIIARAVNTPELASSALELTGPMFWYWLSRDQEAVLLPHLEQLLAGPSPSIPAETRGIAHTVAGWLALRLNRAHRAAFHFHEGAECIADPTHRAWLRGRIGEAHLLACMEHDRARAITILHEVIEHATQRPESWFELSAAWLSIGLHLYMDGQVTEARRHLAEALTISQAHDDHQTVALILLYLAQTDRVSNDGANAITRLHQALPVLVDGGDTTGVLLGIDIAIMVIAQLGDEPFASELAIAAHAIRETAGIQRSLAEQNDIAPALKQLLPGDPGPAASTTSATAADLVQRILAWQTPSRFNSRTSSLAGILSDRELEILHLVAHGKTAPQIADELFVSPHTVKRHMANIRSKLGVRSQAAAVAMLQRDR